VSKRNGTDPVKFAKRLGLKIRQMRHERGWTLEYCEERGHIGWNHLASIEAGKKNINLSTVIVIADLFETTPSDLLKDV